MSKIDGPYESPTVEEVGDGPVGTAPIVSNG